MTRSTGWILALAALMLLGCIGPFADTFDEAVQDTPADYDECCVGADRVMLEKLAGVPVTPVQGGDLAEFRVDAVATTKQLDAAVEQGVVWDRDGDGLIAPDDTHEYVLALVTRLPGADPKVRPSSVVTVFTFTQCPPTTGSPSASPSPRKTPSAAPTSPYPCARTVHESDWILVDDDAAAIPSAILAVRVPLGFTALLSGDRPRQGDPAVDLHTGRAVKFPSRV
ncbi:hypothetical protein AB0K00_17440 [Dactylosporangium sp. NPDC049525]|uniref:hypothetical protein n=1 Tax=Dactylosporangium sp. NPDC049525 TaxID=3154730 RepID=UPI003419DABE